MSSTSGLPFRGATVLLAACALLRGEAIVAAEAPSQRNRTSATANGQSAETSARKQRVATAGVYLLGIVTFVGILLVVMTVMWGSQARRLARREPPPTPTPDPLWYLKSGSAAPRPPPANPPDAPSSTNEP